MNSNRAEIFAIYDEKAKAYQAPFVVPNRGVAIRLVAHEVAHSTSMLSRYPADYHLYKVGEWDETAGQVTPISPLEFIIRLDQTGATQNASE